MWSVACPRFLYADVAQMAERLTRNEQVWGSIPHVGFPFTPAKELFAGGSGRTLTGRTCSWRQDRPCSRARLSPVGPVFSAFAKELGPGADLVAAEMLGPVHGRICPLDELRLRSSVGGERGHAYADRGDGAAADQGRSPDLSADSLGDRAAAVDVRVGQNGYEFLSSVARHNIASPELAGSLAEETGLIVPLGLSVLEQACRCMNDWHRQGVDPDLHLAVNVSPRQLRQPGFAEDVLRAVRDSGLDPRKLILEITENVLVDDSSDTLATLVKLKSRGIRISIDDFGTGDSSLNYLSRYPIDILKIPKSFIESIDGNIEESALAEAVLSLGGSLNLEVIAEGVENGEQLERIVALDCDMWQGYFDSHPEGASHLMERLPRVAGPTTVGKTATRTA